MSSTIATIYCSEFLAIFQRLLTTVVQSVRKREADVSKCATFLDTVLIRRPARICSGNSSMWKWDSSGISLVSVGKNNLEEPG